MKSKRNVILKNSDGNTVNTGDVEFNLSFPTMILNKTRLYDFCKHFAELDDFIEPDYSIEFPSDITEKIKYNQLDVYKKIFESVSHTIEDTDYILSNIPKRGSIIRKIQGIYLHLTIDDSIKSKDKLCQLVFDELLETMHTSNGRNDLYLEDTSFAIQSLMYYAFTKCQILERVPD